MKLPIQKSFRLLKFLNHDQPSYVRALAAGIGYLVGFLATGQLALAAEVAGRFWTHNDFKLGARRLAWYSRRSWLNLDVSQDDFFDLTEGFSNAELDAVEQFLARRRAKLPTLTCAADRMFIAARRLDNNENPRLRDDNIAALNAACNALLEEVDQTEVTVKPKGDRKGDFPIKAAKQTLADFTALFPVADVPWFVISGTFLGLVRENGFLPHDYDIDLGLFEDQADVPALCAAILESDCFVLKKYDHHKSKLVPAPVKAKNPDVPYILKITHVSGIHIDLFIHYREAIGAGVSHWHGSSLHRWENSPFELVSYPFYEGAVFGPSDPDTYLSENYGDWRTPVTDFNCTTDTPNLALVRHPIAVAIFLKRFVTSRVKNPNDAAKLKASLLESGFLSETIDGKLQFSGDLFSGAHT